MKPPETVPLSWGRGDTYTLLFAVIFFAVGCFIHRKAIKAAGTNCRDLVAGIMTDAMQIGPLLMIILDPLLKSVGITAIDFLKIVLEESRITLWFAAFIAIITATMSLIKAKI